MPGTIAATPIYAVRRKRVTRDSRPNTQSDPWVGISSDVIERFIDVLATEHLLAAATRVQYRADLLQLDAWSQRHTGCTLITVSDIQLARFLLLTSAQGARGIARKRRSVGRFYAWLSAMRCRDDDPTRSRLVEKWFLVRTERRGKDRERAAALNIRDRAMFALMVAGGLVADDVSALTLDDLQLDEARLRIETRELLSFIPLGASVVELLRSFIEQSRATLLGGKHSAFVFPSCSGKRLTYSAVWEAIRARTGDGRGFAGE